MSYEIQEKEIRDMSYEIQEVEKHSIILFDGVCNLCSSSVQFIIRNDPKQYFRFSSLQSNFSQSILQKYNLPVDQLQSVILVEDGKIYTASTAALKIARQLAHGWSLCYVFMIIPAFIRNAVYRFIGKNRYKWFGKKEACWIPNQALQQLFIK